MPSLFVALVLRSARRDADLSQRQLATLSGVAPSVVAAAESATRDLKVDIFAQLLRTCGWDLAVVDRAGGPVDGLVEDGRRDGVGRRYPAHLDVRTTGESGDWWGDRWVGAHGVPPRPDRTFDLDRSGRDFRRRSQS